jgi:hypothetical protein
VTTASLETSYLMSAAPTVIRSDAGASIITVESSLRREWEKREAELIAIRRFRNNWDGFDSLAPDPRVVDASIRYLRALRQNDPTLPPRRATVSPDGVIALEWQAGTRFLRVEIEAPGSAEWTEAFSGGSSRFWREEDRQIRADDLAREGLWEQFDTSAEGAAVSVGVR